MIGAFGLRRNASGMTRSMTPSMTPSMSWRMTWRMSWSMFPGMSWTSSLLAIGLYCQVFVSQSLELMGLGFIGLAALILVAAGRVRFQRLTHFDVAAILCAQLSLAIAILGDNSYSCQYSILFLQVYLLVSILSRGMSLDEIMVASAQALALAIATFGITSSAAFFQALNVNAPNRWMLRFAPLGIHPNLIGFIFGGGAVVFVFNAARAKTVGGRLLYYCLAGLSILVVVAASARASFIGLICAGLVVGVLALRRAKMKTIVATLAAFAATVTVFLNPVISYLNVILELHSDTRGVDSGATGRTVIWQKGVELFSSDLQHFLLGGGLRSTAAAGFSVESSYITVILESGMIIGGALILSILVIAARRLRRTLQSSAPDFPANAALSMFMLFVLIESVFNRYMIGVGNPQSLLFLILCAKLALIDATPAPAFRPTGGRALAC